MKIVLVVMVYSSYLDYFKGLTAFVMQNLKLWNQGDEVREEFPPKGVGDDPVFKNL